MNIPTYQELAIILEVSDECIFYDYTYLYIKSCLKIILYSEILENMDINNNIVSPYKDTRATNLNINTYLQLVVILVVSDKCSLHDYTYIYTKESMKIRLYSEIRRKCGY